MPTKKDKLSNLVFRPNIIKGDPDNLVNISWHYEIGKGKIRKRKPLAVEEGRNSEDIIREARDSRENNI